MGPRAPEAYWQRVSMVLDPGTGRCADERIREAWETRGERIDLQRDGWADGGCRWMREVQASATGVQRRWSVEMYWNEGLQQREMQRMLAQHGERGGESEPPAANWCIPPSGTVDWQLAGLGTARTLSTPCTMAIPTVTSHAVRRQSRCGPYLDLHLAAPTNQRVAA